MSVQTPPLHGLGAQSFLSTQPPAPSLMNPLAQAVQADVVALVQASVVQPAMGAHARQVVPSSN